MLPVEILRFVMLFCDVKSIVSMRKSCKLFYSIPDLSFWKEYLSTDSYTLKSATKAERFEDLFPQIAATHLFQAWSIPKLVPIKLDEHHPETYFCKILFAATRPMVIIFGDAKRSNEHSRQIETYSKLLVRATVHPLLMRLGHRIEKENQLWESFSRHWNHDHGTNITYHELKEKVLAPSSKMEYVKQKFSTFSFYKKLVIVHETFHMYLFNYFYSFSTMFDDINGLRKGYSGILLVSLNDWMKKREQFTDVADMTIFLTPPKDLTVFESLGNQHKMRILCAEYDGQNGEVSDIIKRVPKTIPKRQAKARQSAIRNNDKERQHVNIKPYTLRRKNKAY
jgi:hypothetical protein